VTPAQLADAVRDAAAAALSDRDLDPSVLPAAAGVERPRNPGHGDYASNLALQVARKAGLPPRDLAQAIADKLVSDPAIEIAGTGFLNIRLAPQPPERSPASSSRRTRPTGTERSLPASASTWNTWIRTTDLVMAGRWTTSAGPGCGWLKRPGSFWPTASACSE
jgi:hypothetical protein